MKIALTTGLLFSLTMVMYSQESEFLKYNRLREDSTLIWGEGDNDSIAEAKRQAEQDLMKKIQVFMFSKIEATVKEESKGSNATVIEDFQKYYQSFSILSLKGLDFISYQDKKSWKALAFIHRDSLTASYVRHKSKIVGFVQSGISAGKLGYAGECLRNYFWGYLLARVYPDTMHLPAPIGDLSTIPAVALTNALSSALQDVRFSTESGYMDDEVVIVPLSCSFWGEPAMGIGFNYYNKMGTQWDFIDSASTCLLLYDPPTSKRQKTTLNVDYVYEPRMSLDPEIQGLYEIFKEDIKFNNMKNLELDFPFVKEETTKIVIPIKEPEAPPADIMEPTRTKDFNIVLMVLNEQGTYTEFWDILEQYRKLGYIRYGKRVDFPEAKGYIAIVDSNQVHTFLYCNGTKYIDIISKRKLENLSAYKGKRQIWFEGLK